MIFLPALPIPILARDNPRMTTTAHEPTACTSPPRYCRRCNYDLRATTEKRCPECGRPFDPVNPRTTRRRPARRWLRHLRRAAYALLTLFLLLAAVWGWCFWGWYEEHKAILSLKLHPNYPYQVHFSPILTSWPKQHLGPLGFVLDRVDYVDPSGRSDITDITPVARLSHLQYLDLTGTGVSDLAPLRDLRSLRNLDVPKETITDAQVETLRRDLPACTITRQ